MKRTILMYLYSNDIKEWVLLYLSQVFLSINRVNGPHEMSDIIFMDGQ